MVSLRPALALCLTLCVCAPIGAQPAGPAPAPEPTVGLAGLEALLETESRDYLSVAAELDMAIARSQEAAAFSGPDFEASWRYYPEGGAPAEDEIQTSMWLTVGLRYDLCRRFMVRPARVGAAEAEIEAAASARDNARAEALYRLRLLYCQMNSDRLAEQANEQLTALLQEHHAVVEKRREESLALSSDVLAVEAELREAMEAVLRHRREWQFVRSVIARSLGVAEARILPQDGGAASGLPPLEQLVELARQNTPLARRNRALAQRERELRAAARYEDSRLTGFAGYQVRDSGDTGWQHGPVVGLTLSVPLRVGALADAREKQSAAAERQHTIAAEMEELAAEEELRRAHALWEQIRGARRVLAARVAAGREDLRVHEARAASTVAALSADPAKPYEIRERILRIEMENTRLRCEQQKALYGVARYAGDSVLKPSPAAHAGTGLATWVWDAAALASSPAGPERFTAFCRRHGVDTAYVSLNAAARADLLNGPGLGDALAEAAGSGVRISGLLSENSWALPANRAALLEAAGEVIQASEAAHLSAIHLDIEPHALPEWDKAGRRPALVGDLADAVEAVRHRIDEASADLALEVDLPTFYDRVGPESLRRILAAADEVVLMAYEVTDPDRVAASVQAELETARDEGCRVRVALRAADWPTAEALEGAARRLQAALGDSAAFGGLAVQDYTDWEAMPKEEDDAPEG